MCFAKLQTSVRKPNFPRQKKHDFRQKVNFITARLQEARVIPSTVQKSCCCWNNPYLFWVEFYIKNLQLEMTIMYEVKKGLKYIDLARAKSEAPINKFII